jgi:hypothetical protein
MDDGTLLSMTYVKEQKILGWSRHDTQGQFVSVCAVTELPVDSPYLIAKRFLNGESVYVAERMDSRRWRVVDDVFCVDCGVAYRPLQPNAAIAVDSLTGSRGIASVAPITLGANYVSPAVSIDDPTGSGAQIVATVSGGQITGYTVVSPGTAYTSPKVRITDSTGSGATAAATPDTSITVTASAGVFTAGNIGDVLRVGNGIGTVTTFLFTNQVKVSLTSPITVMNLDDPDDQSLNAVAGNWSISTPVNKLTGLLHLNGEEISVLADGGVVEGLTVNNGEVDLPQLASNIVVGLPFQVQLQSMYTDIPGEATVQGRRKLINAVTLRVAQSRGAKVGVNQPDASTQPNQANIPWTGLHEIKERGPATPAGNAIPLLTGDERIIVSTDWKKPGQVAVQMDDPLPLTVLALIPEVIVGDDNG